MDTKYPKDVAVKNAWAQYLWDRDEKSAAVEKWSAAVAIDPRNDLALSRLGEAALEFGEVKKAAGFYTRASESAPKNAAYHFDLANIIFLFRFDILDAEAPNAEAMIRRARDHFAEAARLEPLNVEYAKAYANIFYDLKPADWEGALDGVEPFHGNFSAEGFWIRKPGPRAYETGTEGGGSRVPGANPCAGFQPPESAPQ